MSYDLGAIYFEDIPAAVPFMEILELAESNEVLIRWVNPSITVHGNPLNNISSIKIFKNEELLAEITNPLAENADTLDYLDLIDLPEYYRYTICILDSELVVKQLLGKYKVKNEKLLELFLEVQKLQENFDTIRYEHA